MGTIFVSLNHGPCMTRPAIIDLNPVELNYYPFMISLVKCNGICNVLDDFFTTMCVQSGTKDADVKVFNMIAKINEAKILVQHISCDCNCKFGSTTYI